MKKLDKPNEKANEIVIDDDTSWWWYCGNTAVIWDPAHRKHLLHPSVIKGITIDIFCKARRKGKPEGILTSKDVENYIRKHLM